MTDLTKLGVAAIRSGVADGDFTALEVAEAFNANVAAAKVLNAFIVETPEKAVEAAKAVDADRSAGKSLGKMAGVPIGMKDLFATEGVQTTAASHILEGFVPTYESTVSANLWKAGAGMLGKLSEELHLHRAEQCFGSPECGAGLEDAIGNNVHAAMMQ